VEDVLAAELRQRLVREWRCARVTRDLIAETTDRVDGGRIGRAVAD
jgi:hypothetical protein